MAVARRVVEQTIGEKLDGSPLEESTKNPHAVALGKLGGAKGGNFVEFDNATGSSSAAVREDQTFTIALPVGHHYLDHEVGRGYIVQRVVLEGRDIFEEGLTISGPGQIALEIVLSKDGGQLAGVVADKDGTPVPGATVVLAPEARLRPHQDLFLHSRRTSREDMSFRRYSRVTTRHSRGGMWSRESGGMPIL
jgi:hypothetical protein